MTPLSNTVSLVAELREQLKAAYGLEDGEQALEDTLEGESDLFEQLAAIARDALRAEAMAKGMAELIKDNQNRKARLEHRADKLRTLIAWAMQESGTRKIPVPDMTLTLAVGKPPLIVDNEAIPERFCRIKYEPDIPKIREAIESGEQLPFARLGNASPVLTIRTK